MGGLQFFVLAGIVLAGVYGLTGVVCFLLGCSFTQLLSIAGIVLVYFIIAVVLFFVGFIAKEDGFDIVSLAALVVAGTFCYWFPWGWPTSYQTSIRQLVHQLKSGDAGAPSAQELPIAVTRQTSTAPARQKLPEETALKSSWGYGFLNDWVLRNPLGWFLLGLGIRAVYRGIRRYGISESSLRTADNL